MPMLPLSFSEKEKLGEPKEEIGNLKMDLNICILVISRYNICNLKICILVILRYNISNLNILRIHISYFRGHDTAGKDVLVIFLHEATQSMAMAAQASSTPYNPQTLDLPRISTLVSFYHACLGIPVKQTWLGAIQAGNCDTFDGPTYSNVARYCPDANKTILGHLAQQPQNVRSPKPKLPTPPAPPAPLPTAPSPTDVPSNQVFIMVHPLSRLYTDDAGCYLVRACSGNQYVMIAFHANGNLILQQAFKSKSDRHHIAAYNAIMTRLSARGLSMTSTFLTTRPAWHSKKQSPSSGMPNSNLSHWICITETGLNTLFAHSRTIFLQYWQASTLHFPRTFGTF